MSQTLAGRTGILHLLPLAIDEVGRFPASPKDLFSTLVAGEVYKAHASRGLAPHLFHLRETRGLEVDLLIDRGADLRGVECKSGATVASDALDGLARLESALGDQTAIGRGVLVYGGQTRQRRSKADVVPWHALSRLDWFGK